MESNTMNDAVQVDQVHASPRFADGLAAMARAAELADPPAYRVFVRHGNTRHPRVEIQRGDTWVTRSRFKPEASPVVTIGLRGTGGLRVTWVRGDSGQFEPQLGLVPALDPDRPPLRVPWPVQVRGADPARREPEGCLVVEIDTTDDIGFHVGRCS